MRLCYDDHYDGKSFTDKVVSRQPSGGNLPGKYISHPIWWLTTHHSSLIQLLENVVANPHPPTPSLLWCLSPELFF